MRADLLILKLGMIIWVCRSILSWCCVSVRGFLPSISLVRLTIALLRLRQSDAIRFCPFLVRENLWWWLDHRKGVRWCTGLLRGVWWAVRKGARGRFGDNLNRTISPFWTWFLWTFISFRGLELRALFPLLSRWLWNFWFCPLWSLSLIRVLLIIGGLRWKWASLGVSWVRVCWVVWMRKKWHG